jgi:hypothetical protein
MCKNLDNLKIEKVLTAKVSNFSEEFMERIDGYADYNSEHGQAQWFYELETLKSIFKDDFSDEPLTSQLKYEFERLMTLMSDNATELLCVRGD